MADGELTDGLYTEEELQLAARNRGMPLEGLAYELTPTGIHYLLVHFDIPLIDPTTWRLEIGGNVERAISLGLDEIRSFTPTTIAVTMECAGNGRTRMSPRALSQPWILEAIGTAEWTGVPLRDVLSRAAIKPDTVELVFTGADHGVQGDIEQDYARSLTIDDALRPEVLLAYEMNGRQLEPQHGAPLRLLVPGWYGMTSVKWLTRVDAVTEAFQGWQQAVAYRDTQTEDDPGVPVQRIKVRALMIPPGFPDFPARHRLLDAGMVTLRGRAWSGRGEIARVEVGIDGRWHDARLDDPLGPFAWRGWSYEWKAKAGTYELSCRATDATGDVQPIEARWNTQGLANNLVQTLSVTVR